jgi:hypothetical protein
MIREAEKHGRLTTGKQPLHVRRKGIADTLNDSVHTISTMIKNWPNEYVFPADHDIHELLRVMTAVADNLTQPEK